ncbi:hypothetical protein PP175_17385 [Aneurinibacillus sp. Ricciae_BoGa-3]|uniref:hypothetical protein n=1 Tax=Aneurinibacillus sp. Ricciae_BoGa-3 TaxID=3022697 RepID=UPI0023416E5C|nr:hypothetical protein [Aneurinibacillus sp. Ricciae_BoGa-3]WCK53167.1 hypothetical protein PP175_17385 [Aneurinibacillus sp. Ricciae_BoGa-3]
MLRVLRFIHVLAGLVGSVLIVLLAATGLLLNHRSFIGYSSDTAFQLQKLIFSLHTGAVGSHSFIWLTDLGAICMITLAITGTWLWTTSIIQRKGVQK